MLLLWAVPASAHQAVNGATGRDAWVTALLLASALVYGVGALRLARRAHAHEGRETAYFALAWLTLALALHSPLEDLAARSFAAHMLQHLILMTVAAPWLVLAAPWPRMLWALPRLARRGAARAFKSAAARRLRALFGRPWAAFAWHAAALWAWHLPAAFDAATTHESVHRLQHLSFFASALLFWYAVLRGSRTPATALALLFCTMMHSGLLGALLSLAPVALYAPYRAFAGSASAALSDQQLGGLLMWVPGGFVYAAVALAILARVLLRSEAASRAN
ncbi:MAG TPA: cytochrome c oxidase assembly protein [Gammaproteobacteria bacterium]|nr:cytochrome c oxidase assembly protein [Gammaproteobacteria bacterium]